MCLFFFPCPRICIFDILEEIKGIPRSVIKTFWHRFFFFFFFCHGILKFGVCGIIIIFNI